VRVVTLKIPDGVYFVLKDLSRKRGVGLSTLIREVLSSIDDLNLLRIKKTKTVTITVEEDFYEALNELAKEKGVSVTQLIKESLLMRYDFLRKYVRKPPRRSGKKEIVVKRYVLY